MIDNMTDKMTDNSEFEIFLATAPGLERLLLAEVVEAGFKQPKRVGGGSLLWAIGKPSGGRT